ncbi:hypothetical protein LRP49_02960 [Enterovibrio sp. ZSDZ35]|uniref:Uncharacterized protein n=1 Tax=Enterovibrio qingdaonensis TaxID=2899818 RepID=A0ABT5QIL9_9GAMM|nr:hypothetical protein [Enterovibrio sp. ZSDZ35]MDD1780151.1 hypothetical protein [Enterovibrio sp. ZSDZ35]
MRQFIQRLPFLITLLMALLIGNSVAVVSQDLLLAPTTLAAHQDSQPDASLDRFLLRYTASRINEPDTEPSDNDTVPWPIVLQTVAMLLLLFRVSQSLPRSYLLTDNHRLAGWQDTNLQFRFIHTR